MLFKIDENLHPDVAAAFRVRGHDALTVRDQGMRGHPDSGIASVCRSERRAIVTLDLDFADVRCYPPNEYSGLIVLRLHDESRVRVLAVPGGLRDIFETRSPVGQLWIVEEHRVRIHGQLPEEMP